MITLLTSLKPFRGPAIRLQENALSNWRKLDPKLEIVIYGEGEGIAERALRYGAKHIAGIRGNENGIPDFSAIIEHAAANARHEIQVYLNGDILLPPNFIQEVMQISFEKFLMIGQRIDLNEEAVFDHHAEAWEREILSNFLRGQAQLHNPAGQDYFVFRRGTWQDLAPLIVGRGGYDNALVAYCLRRRIPIIDATWSIHVVHQWHDYSHVRGANETFCGSDALANARLHDIEHSNPDIEDANWRLIDKQVFLCGGSPSLLRRIEVFIRYTWGMKHLSYICRGITRIALLCGALKPRELDLDSIVRDESRQT